MFVSASVPYSDPAVPPPRPRFVTVPDRSAARHGCAPAEFTGVRVPGRPVDDVSGGLTVVDVSSGVDVTVDTTVEGATELSFVSAEQPASVPVAAAASTASTAMRDLMNID
ncbi:hypothetical protein GCM10009619_30480 [Williamsia maris]